MRMMNIKFKIVVTSAKEKGGEIEEGYTGDINCICNILAEW